MHRITKPEIHLDLRQRAATAFGSVAAQVVERNNAFAQKNSLAADFEFRPDVAWARSLRAAWPTIRSEWDALKAQEYRFPSIEQVLNETAGNDGVWSFGVIVMRPARSPLRSVAIEPMASLMPKTTALVLSHRSIRSATLSILQPGTTLRTHRGPNGGVLRYHLGIDCPHGAALITIDRDGAERVTPYLDGEDFLFDDTTDHSAHNLGERPRVTLFCEIERPMPHPAQIRNRVVQSLIALDPRYRLIPERVASWSAQLDDAESAAAYSSEPEITGAGGAHISGSGSTPSR